MSTQAQTLVHRQRVTSQLIEVPPASSLTLGGAARLSNDPRPVSSIYSRATDDMSNYNSRLADRASSIYPPTISPPDSPYPSEVNSSNPDISPISTTGPAPAWLRPSGIPQPSSARRPSPTDTPEPRQEPTPSTSGTTSGWRDVVRSIRRSPSPAASPSLQPQNSGSSGSATRWDTYSGEKTLDNHKGKPGAASPNQHPYKGTDPGFGYTAHITGGNNDGAGKPAHFLHVKLRKATDRAASPSPTPSQEPWRSASGVQGPSGRTATVDPVADKPVPAEKRHFPTPAERRAKGFFQRPGASGRASPGPNAALAVRNGAVSPPPSTDEKPNSALRVMTGALDSMREAASKAMTQKETRPCADPTRPDTAMPDGEVVVGATQVYRYRLGSSRAESPASPAPPDYGPPPPSQLKSQLPPQPHHRIARRPSQDMLRGAYPEHAGPRSATLPIGGSNSHMLMSSPVSYSPPVNSYTLPPRYDSRKPLSSQSASAADGLGFTATDFDPGRMTRAFHTMGIANEPQSRFSATTYGTSIAGTDSPPATPKMAQAGADAVPPLPSPSATGESILNRKRPVPSASNQFKAKPTRKPTPMQNAIAAAADEPATPLPVDPPKPVDRVAALEEKLNQLAKRKASLTAVIHELTNVVQPSSIVYDMASRAEIKKTVEGLRVERDAVLKEIQEVGIKLHRAIKKRDEEMGGDGTGLWVRRVTNE